MENKINKIKQRQTESARDGEGGEIKSVEMISSIKRMQIFHQKIQKTYIKTLKNIELLMKGYPAQEKVLEEFI